MKIAFVKCSSVLYVQVFNVASSLLAQTTECSS